jgi:hypothetical protein
MRLSQGARGASAPSRDAGSHLAGRRIAMIAKDFFMAKDFRTYAIKNLRQEKILRDHGRITTDPVTRMNR